MTFTEAPTTISTTGTKDVTVDLSEWMHDLPLKPVKYANGDVFDRRRGRLQPGGRYKVDAGAWTPTDLDLDINGAHLFVPAGNGLGIPIPEGPWKTHMNKMWPRARSTLHLEARSHVYSSQPGGRIWGGNFTPSYLGTWAIGTEYFGQKFEGQHAVRVADDDCVVNTKKLELAWTFGDGCYVEWYVHGTEINGTRNRLNALNSAGGAVRNGKWVPSKIAVPGIHHIGRQGVAQSGGSDLWMHDVTMYQVKRSWLDFEPGAEGTFDTALIENNVAGVYQGLFIASAGNGYVNNITARGNLAVHKPLSIVARHAPRAGRRSNWSITDNVAERKAFHGSPLALMRFDGYDNVEIARNTQYIDKRQAGRGTYFEDCTNVSCPDPDKQFILV